MKRLFALIVALIICILPVLPVYADTISETDIVIEYIVDKANILSEEEELVLKDSVLAAKEKYGCDIGVYTVDMGDVSYSDMLVFDCVDEHYNAAGFTNDGILLMVYFIGDELGTYVKTSGDASGIVSDLDLYVISNNYEKYLSDGSYYAAAESFVNDCEKEYQRHNMDFDIAEPLYIKDDADILTDEQEEKLKAEILEIKEVNQADVAFYSVDFGSASISDYEAKCYAEEHYKLSGLSQDGILLMVFFAGNGNGTHMTTSGECIKMFTEDDFIFIEDNFYGYLADHKYYNAVKSFVSDAGDDIYDYKHFDGIWFFIGPAIGAIASFFSVGKMKGDLKTVRSKPDAAGYTKPGSMNITNSSDVFLYRRVTRTARPKETSSGSSGRSGGGSFGGHSGRRF